MKIVLSLLALLSCVTTGNASVYNCPVVGVFPGATLLGATQSDGSSPWEFQIRGGGGLDMFVTGTTLFCKYDSILLTKEVGKDCVLDSDTGKIITAPHFKDSKYCTFPDEVFRKKTDCFVVCP